MGTAALAFASSRGAKLGIVMCLETPANIIKRVGSIERTVGTTELVHVSCGWGIVSGADIRRTFVAALMAVVVVVGLMVFQALGYPTQMCSSIFSLVHSKSASSNRGFTLLHTTTTTTTTNTIYYSTTIYYLYL
jgi:hypothetical protein